MIINIHYANFLSFRQETTRRRGRECRVATVAERKRHIFVLNVERDFVIVYLATDMGGSVSLHMCHLVQVHDYHHESEELVITLLYIWQYTYKTWAISS